ncbi:MAG: ATP-binding cassette domain-containing protein [Planctomycetota bacterium]|nr:MAG: ATP-binding cassette domain-containing protein [Planctomycetota bacterium]
MDANGNIVISFENAYKTLSGRNVLDGMTFDVRRGETFVIIGPSGMGKSVTLKHMVGLMRPDDGEVIISDEGEGGRVRYDVSHLKPIQLERLRAIFGYLFQDGALLASLTVGENVALPLFERRLHVFREKYGRRNAENKIWERVREKLGMVDMVHAIDNLPAELSGGMRKRAGLARAIIHEPKIILYDEPTSGLDPVMGTNINRLIRHLQEKLGVTSLVVTHDIDSAYYVGDRIAMINRGRMEQIGTPDEIKNTTNPVVRQFIEGNIEGPLTAGRKH